MDILDILLDILLKPPQPFIGLFLIIFSSHHDALEITSLINISTQTRNAVCVINGRHLSHRSWRYASYWNAICLIYLSDNYFYVSDHQKHIPVTLNHLLNVISQNQSLIIFSAIAQVPNRRLS